jgi:hypothetical protein
VKDKLTEAVELLVVFIMSVAITAGSCVKSNVGGSCGGPKEAHIEAKK